MSQRNPDIRILYLANNPVAHAHPLQLDREEEIIREELTRQGANDAFPLRALTNASIDDLHDALLSAPNTQVLHLAGHGSKEHGILTTDGEGRRVAMNGTRLAQFLIRYPSIRLVILGACHQFNHAEALKQFVPCVIATSDAIGDDVALNFTRALYKELATGSTVGDAYESASAVAGLSHGDRADVLYFAHREAINPRWVELEPVEHPVSADTAREADRRTRAAVQAKIDGIHDVIITAHTGGWQHIVPHDPRADPHVIELDTGAEGWQRHYPPDAAAWKKAAEAVRASVREAKSAQRRRVHVAVKMPFELGALLASELEQHNREVIFYQETPLRGAATPKDHRVWQAWGPGMPDARPDQRRSAVFQTPIRRDDPYEPACDVALLVPVTQPIAPALARAAIESPQAQIQTVQLIPHAEAGPDVIDAFNIDKATEELAHEIEGMTRHYPALRTLHLFYAGPLALLMRAAGRLQVRSHPVYLYSYFPRAPDKARYVRMFELRDRRLVLPGAE